LQVLRPNVLTRVSEYVPEIIAFIEKIIQNGLAYESSDSIYFDVKAFDKRDNHFYAKLVPEAYGDTSSLNEGEGILYCIFYFIIGTIKYELLIFLLLNFYFENYN
jgi:cysteinyl-tRNA synthetase